MARCFTECERCGEVTYVRFGEKVPLLTLKVVDWLRGEPDDGDEPDLCADCEKRCGWALGELEELEPSALGGFDRGVEATRSAIAFAVKGGGREEIEHDIAIDREEYLADLTRPTFLPRG
jgi:hypothetical protein